MQQNIFLYTLKEKIVWKSVILGPAEHQEKIFPMGPIYDDYDYDPWESHEKEEGDPNGWFISYPEHVSEQPSPGTSQPASVIHSLALAIDIQPCVNNCGT
jgi:hypothetical protein